MFMFLFHSIHFEMDAVKFFPTQKGQMHAIVFESQGEENA